MCRVKLVCAWLSGIVLSCYVTIPLKCIFKEQHLVFKICFPSSLIIIASFIIESSTLRSVVSY